MAINPELKRAILDLPEKERVKLLLKLIGKDAVLIKQLHYQLIEGVESLDEKRNEVIKKIDIKNAGFMRPATTFFFIQVSNPRL